MRALALVLLAACAARDPYEPLDEEQMGVETFDLPQWIPFKLDLLFVVDRSPAMAPYEANVRAGVEIASEVLHQYRSQDFHVGVISADVAGGGHLVGGTYLAERKTYDGGRSASFAGELTEVLPELVDLGHAGEPSARPFDAVQLAFAQGLDPGFRRADARLAVIFVVAEDDASVTSPAEVAAALKAQTPVGEIWISLVHGAQAPRLAAIEQQFPNRTMSTRIDAENLEEIVGPQGFDDTHVGDPCLSRTPPGAVDCQFSDVASGVEQVLPACASGELPCWHLVGDPVGCPSPAAIRVDIQRIEFPPRGTHVIGQCVTR